jgi:hypothetical protein
MSNLLSKASIVLTPTAYSDGTLHSVKPIQTFGSELVTNGDFATDSNWIKGSGWTIIGGTANQDGGNGILRQNNLIPTNTRVKATFDLTNYGGSGALTLKFAPNTYPITLNGNGTYTVFTDGTNSLNRDLQIIASGGFVGSIDNVSVKEVIDADFDFTRPTTATETGIGSRENSSGNIESVAANLPRIDYLGGTAHILLEPQSTNTATYSNDFTQGSIFDSSNAPSVNAVLTSQQATSPDGTNNAWLLKDNNSGGTGVVALRYFDTNVTSNDFNTISIFVKKALANDFILLKSGGFDTNGNGSTWFNINDGTLGNVSGSHTAKIEDYGSGFYRCSITFKSITDVAGSIQLQLASTNGSDQVTKDGTNGVYIFGIQCEADTSQDFATSYIPTSGTTVTRSADEANNSGSSDLISSTEGVLYIEAKTDNSSVGSISINDGTLSTRITARFRTDTSKIQMTTSGSTNDFNFNSATITLSQYNKIAIVYNSSGQYYFFINGVKSAVQSKGTFGSNSFTQLDFNRGGGGEVFQGKVKCVAVFKEALTDAQLTSLTT